MKFFDRGEVFLLLFSVLVVALSLHLKCCECVSIPHTGGEMAAADNKKLERGHPPFSLERKQQENSKQVVNNIDSDKEAFVTFLTSDDFLLGARVLRQSLIETNTDRSYIIFCSEKVSQGVRDVLSLDGWIVRDAKTIDNPFEGGSLYFADDMTKLYVWTLMEYRRIVYLDSDVLVVQNIDSMFNCGQFCASFRHSDLFNAGVLVLEPSMKVFKDMNDHFLDYKSYDGADQGFLNSYFGQLKRAPLFNPKATKRSDEKMRLPAGFNADVGMYYLISSWRIPRDELYIVHYTPVKPWKWYVYPLFDPCWEWNAVRNRLQTHHMEPSITNMECILPLVCILAVMVLFQKVWSPFQVFRMRLKKNFVATIFRKITWVYPLVSLCGSYYLAFSLVPTMVPPFQGWTLFTVWVVLWLLVFYQLYFSFIPASHSKSHCTPWRSLSSSPSPSEDKCSSVPGWQAPHLEKRDDDLSPLATTAVDDPAVFEDGPSPQSTSVEDLKSRQWGTAEEEGNGSVCCVSERDANYGSSCNQTHSHSCPHYNCTSNNALSEKPGQLPDSGKCTKRVLFEAIIWLFLYVLIFQISRFLFCYHVGVFSVRAKVFVVFCVGEVLCTHLVGGRILRLWNGL